MPVILLGFPVCNLPAKIPGTNLWQLSFRRIILLPQGYLMPRPNCKKIPGGVVDVWGGGGLNSWDWKRTLKGFFIDTKSAYAFGIPIAELLGPPEP